jgi:hypothetical protein
MPTSLLCLCFQHIKPGFAGHQGGLECGECNGACVRDWGCDEALKQLQLHSWHSTSLDTSPYLVHHVACAGP